MRQWLYNLLVALSICSIESQTTEQMGKQRAEMMKRK